MRPETRTGPKDLGRRFAQERLARTRPSAALGGIHDRSSLSVMRRDGYEEGPEVCYAYDGETHHLPAAILDRTFMEYAQKNASDAEIVAMSGTRTDRAPSFSWAAWRAPTTACIRSYHTPIAQSIMQGFADYVLCKRSSCAFFKTARGADPLQGSVQRKAAISYGLVAEARDPIPLPGRPRAASRRGARGRARESGGQKRPPVAASRISPGALPRTDRGGSKQRGGRPRPQDRRRAGSLEGAARATAVPAPRNGGAAPERARQAEQGAWLATRAVSV